eukprot:m.50724 g.50724  ORF g.50724 m.50724 type:complete len:210 (+) comp7259_c1_seq1:309-938(+)
MATAPEAAAAASGSPLATSTAEDAPVTTTDVSAAAPAVGTVPVAAQADTTASATNGAATTTLAPDGATTASSTSAPPSNPTMAPSTTPATAATSTATATAGGGGSVSAPDGTVTAQPTESEPEPPVEVILVEDTAEDPVFPPPPDVILAEMPLQLSGDGAELQLILKTKWCASRPLGNRLICGASWAVPSSICLEFILTIRRLCKGGFL